MANITYPYRHCGVYISTKYKHIMFVPLGRIKNGMSAEHENVISDVWPCDFGKLRENIEEALDRALVAHSNFDPFKYRPGHYPSYDNSKAKSETSFRSEYVLLRVETDNAREYGQGEAERVKVIAHPTSLDTTYRLTGTYHLLDTKVAQLVLDIFEACMKIRE
jgi:hypothetical protein